MKNLKLEKFSFDVSMEQNNKQINLNIILLLVDNRNNTVIIHFETNKIYSSTDYISCQYYHH